MKGNEQRKQQGRFLSNSGEDGSKPSTRSRWRAAGEDGGGDIHQRERWLKLESLEIYQGFASHGGRSEEGGGRMDHVRLRKRSRRKWRNDQLGPFRSSQSWWTLSGWRALWIKPLSTRSCSERFLSAAREHTLYTWTCTLIIWQFS